MKRLLVFVIAFVLFATLACGGNDPNQYEMQLTDGTTITVSYAYCQANAGTVYCYDDVPLASGLSEPVASYQVVSFRRK